MTRWSRQLAAVTAWGLPPWSTGPADVDRLYEAAAAAGYEGIQVLLPAQVEPARAAGLADVSGIGRARTVDAVEPAAAAWRDEPVSSLTLHLGTGMETAAEARVLVEAALEAAGSLPVPLLVETHRGTLFTDPARTLALVDEHPELRFTADLSHWYTGAEMVYGDLPAKLAALRPVFERCRMVHGRISDPGCIQVAVRADDRSDHVAHFRQMWGAVLAGCVAADIEVLPFVVELLPAAAGYARTVDRGAGPVEETDRWEQATVLWDIVRGIDPVPAA